MAINNYTNNASECNYKFVFVSSHSIPDKAGAGVGWGTPRPNPFGNVLTPEGRKLATYPTIPHTTVSKTGTFGMQIIEIEKASVAASTAVWGLILYMF